MNQEVENEHFLYPSTLFTSKAPTTIRTILGSCVAICLWDTVNHYGGMNHYMLPFWNGNGLASPKYGNIAISKLINKMLEYGSLKNNIVAKVFGGGEVIDVQTANFFIGQRNAEIAFDLLKDENIKIVAKSTGGKLGRRIKFNTFSGDVLMNYIKKINN